MTKKQRIRQRRLRIAIVALGAVLLGLILIALAWWLGGALLKPGESGTSAAESSGSSAGSSSPASQSSPDVSQSSSEASQGSSDVSQGETSSSSATTVPTVPPAQDAATYIQPEGEEWFLTLVNDYNKAPDWCADEEFIVNYGAGVLFDSRAHAALEEMVAAGRAAGISDMRPQSTFRRISVQERLFNNKVNEYKRQGYDQADAEELANTVVKRPGHSEHHTGLAVDMGGSGDFSITMSFENTAAFEWLSTHCQDYGFILRFPKDKEDITGVIYEPWHYRYVGKEHATYIMEHGLCLEEYLAMKGM